MTEHPADPILEDDFDLDAWLSAGTLARRAVQIFNAPHLAAEYDILATRLAEAEATTADEDATVGTKTAVHSIHAEMSALADRWEASKAFWTVRALTEDEIRAIYEQHPDPDVPELIRKKRAPGEVWDDEQRAAADAFVTARDENVNERNMAMIACAVVEVSCGGRTRRSVTVDQVRKLRARPHGKEQTQRLLSAIESATTGEVEVPRPMLPGRSETARA